MDSFIFAGVALAVGAIGGAVAHGRVSSRAGTAAAVGLVAAVAALAGDQARSTYYLRTESRPTGGNRG